MPHEVSQIILALIGAIASIGIAYFSRTRRAGLPGSEDAAPSGRSSAFAQQTGSSRSLLDLAIVLVLGAFFSLLLADSLNISGRIPSLDLNLLGKITLITLLTVGSLVITWRFNRAELGVGIIGLTTTAVLLLSPGGSFVEAAKTDAEKGISVLLPLVILVLSTSAAVIYVLGNPLSLSASRRSKLTSAMALLAMILISALSLGQEYASTTLANHKAPKLEEAGSQRLLDQIRLLPVDDRAALYGFASEIALSPTYQELFFQVSPSVDETPPVKCPGAGASRPPNPEFTQSPGPSFGGAYQAPSRGVEQGAGRALAEASSKKAARRVRLKAIADDVLQVLALDKQLPFMLDRLLWVHPTGRAPGAGQSALPLPGIKAATRLEATSTYRVYAALREQQNTAGDFLALFQYDARISDSFKPEDYELRRPSSKSFLSGLLGSAARASDDESAFAQEYRVHGKSLFPTLPSRDYLPRLQEVLALPKAEEAFIALSMYRTIVRSTQKPNLQKALAQFEALPPDAQRAFVHYLASPENRGRNYYALRSVVPPREAERFQDEELLPLRCSPLSMRKLQGLVAETNNNSADEFLTIATKLRAILGQSPSGSDSNYASRRGRFIELLRSDNNQIPLRNLFSDNVFALTDALSALNEEEQALAFSLMRNPVSPAVKQLAEMKILTAKFQNKQMISALQEAEKTQASHKQISTLSMAVTDSSAAVERASKIDSLLESYMQLSTDRESMLHWLAISLYRADGDSSLSPLQLLIVEARELDPLLSVLCAMLIMLPLFCGATAVGGMLARAAVFRDRLLTIVEAERLGEIEGAYKVGTAVEIFGRDSLLAKLARLGGRGWSTIGLVGRRGIGKSRILYELYRRSIAGNVSPAEARSAAEPQRPARCVGIWVAAPSQFEEEDFVAATFERLARGTEVAIASFLGANPEAVRKIDAMITRVSLFVLAGVIFGVAGTFYVIYERLVRPEIMVTWIPILITVIVGVLVALVHVSRMQPVDLTPWLERDRSQSPHAVLLYRRAQVALRCLSKRKPVSQFLAWDPQRRVIARAVSVVLFLFMIISVLGAVAMNGSMREFFFWCAIVAGGLALFSFLSSGGSSSGANLETDSPSNLLALVAEYREFAGEVVHRLKRGALGDKAAESSMGVIICIDELDKIVGTDQQRAFLRKIKALFEVPGCHYYLSLSEDAFGQLYLGSIDGKNEVDSALDHIVRVPPIELGDAVRIAKEYCATRGPSTVGVRLQDIIAVLSFGIARDVIRGCDEWLSSDAPATVDPVVLAANKRSRILQLAHDDGDLDTETTVQLSGQAVDVARECRQVLIAALGAEGKNATLGAAVQGQQRKIFMVWLIALLEISVVNADDPTWQRLIQTMFLLGYNLPTAKNFADLYTALDALHSQIAPRTA